MPREIKAMKSITVLLSIVSFLPPVVLCEIKTGIALNILSFKEK